MRAACGDSRGTSGSCGASGSFARTLGGWGPSRVHGDQLGGTAASPLPCKTHGGHCVGHSRTLGKLVLQKAGQEPRTVTSWSLHCAPGHFRHPGVLVRHPAPMHTCRFLCLPPSSHCRQMPWAQLVATCTNLL